MAGLNELQRQAAENLTDHILLLAPAGTGKTNTLAYRIANILAAGKTEPEEILCLTFTNKACREMRDRIEERVGEAGRRVLVRTFHAFCYDVLRMEAKRSGDFFSDAAIFDEVDCQSLLRDLLEEDWPLLSVQNLVAELKTERASRAIDTGDVFADYRLALECIRTEQETRLRRLAVDGSFHFYNRLFLWWCGNGPRVTAEYDQRLHELHGLDFTDLIAGAARLLAEDAVAIKWARRFAYIHIDEVQDTSELEYAILSRIFGTSRLLLAGDCFQTIYEWRRSRPECVLHQFELAYHPIRIVLTKNYRATQTLLSAAFGVLKGLFGRRVADFYPQGIHAASTCIGAPILLKSAMDFAEEAQWIYGQIQQLAPDDVSRICILTRSNRYNKELSGQFRSLSTLVAEEERLPFMRIDDMKFFRRQEIKDVLAFLKLIVNKHDTASCIRLLNRFGRGIGPATIRKIAVASYRAAGIRITDYLDDAARRFGDPFAVLLTALDEENVVVFDVEATGLDATRDEIVQIAGIRLAKDGTAKAKFNRLLTPSISVGTSERVHHITDAWLREHGENARNVLQAFCAFAKGSVIVGHNVTYDLSILGSHLARLGLPQLDFRTYYDTLDLFRRFYPELPNYKLSYLGKFCSVSHESTHDAFDDIRATAEILHYVVEHDVRPHEKERRTYIAKWKDGFEDFAMHMHAFREAAGTLRPWQLLGRIVVDAGIDAYYRARREEQRIENLRDLFRQARDFDDPSMRPMDAVLRFLRYATLSTTELDALSTHPKIPILTIHQAKGTEFDYVFLAGLQEGTFPSFSIGQDDRMEEEARLFYVAITRAKKQLFLSWSQYLYGHERTASRFLRALPRDRVERL